MASKRILKKMTVDKYLAYEPNTGVKREYLDGKLRLVDKSSPQHNKIMLNCLYRLKNHLALAPYLVYDTIHHTNRRIKVGDKNYLHPDIFIMSLDSQFMDKQECIITNPILIAEVMSPKSKNYDRGTKGQHYLKNQNHKIVLFIFEEEPRITIYTPYEDGWLLQDFEGLDAIVPLDAIGCDLKMSEVYLDVFE